MPGQIKWKYVKVCVLFYIKSKDTITVQHEKFSTTWKIVTFPQRIRSLHPLFEFIYVHTSPPRSMCSVSSPFSCVWKSFAFEEIVHWLEKTYFPHWSITLRYVQNTLWETVGRRCLCTGFLFGEMIWNNDAKTVGICRLQTIAVFTRNALEMNREKTGRIRLSWKWTVSCFVLGRVTKGRTAMGEGDEGRNPGDVFVFLPG